MESGDQFATIVLGLVFSAGTVITISILWLQLRGRMKALDVLRAYAERGEEPPAPAIRAGSGRAYTPTLKRLWLTSRAGVFSIGRQRWR
jgi:hypothetical protein